MYGLSSDFQKRDVAIYARVSTEHEAQLSALENQIDWYKPILAARPDWTLTAQYIDEGITGTSAEKRPQFMKMIDDARQKKFNMIITREVSRFARNTVDAVMDLSYSMLEKHIADQEDIPDYTEEIKHKESEIERLSKKRVNLIEMRAEGDIDKELFRERKQKIENRIAILTEEIKTLQPDETKQSPQDYMQKLQELRERLKEYTGFEYSVIPESIVEAFIEKIWVSKDEFRWYLRSGNGSSDEFDIDDHIKIASFTLTIDDAKKYLYSFSTRRRVYNWKDLNVSVWI